VVSDGSFAFLHFEVVGKDHRLYPCSVRTLAEKVGRAQTSFAYPKESPLKDLFDFFLLQMMKGGLVDKTLKANVEEKPKSDCVESADPRLGMSTCFAVFFVILAGVLLSVSISVVEFALDRKVGKKRISLDLEGRPIVVRVNGLRPPERLYKRLARRRSAH